MVLDPPTLHAIHTVDNLRAESGGPSRSVPSVCDALAATGAQVTLVSAETDAHATLVRPTHSGVQLELVAADPRAGLLRGASTPFGHAVARALLPGAPAVVHTHGLWVPSNRAAALVARRAGAPLVVSPKGMLSERALRVKRAKKQIGWQLYQRRTLSAAAAFQATSEAEAEDIRRLGFRQPVAVIPHGVAVPPPTPRRTAPATRTALFLSRFHPIKGVPDLVEAWARVRPPGWRLKLVGPDEGGHRETVRELVAERGLAGEIDICGAVDDVGKSELFATADLFVLATHSENFGVVIAEALAAGLPVLTTHGAPWQVLEEQACGWWVAADPAAIANALQDATKRSPEVLRAMGERGRAYTERALSWRQSASAHLALYRWLLGFGDRPEAVRATPPA